MGLRSERVLLHAETRAAAMAAAEVGAGFKCGAQAEHEEGVMMTTTVLVQLLWRREGACREKDGERRPKALSSFVSFSL